MACEYASHQFGTRICMRWSVTCHRCSCDFAHSEQSQQDSWASASIKCLATRALHEASAHRFSATIAPLLINVGMSMSVANGFCTYSGDRATSPCSETPTCTSLMSLLLTTTGANDGHWQKGFLEQSIRFFRLASLLTSIPRTSTVA